jgi:hypothetical protein
MPTLDQQVPAAPAKPALAESVPSAPPAARPSAAGSAAPNGNGNGSSPGGTGTEEDWWTE